MYDENEWNIYFAYILDSKVKNTYLSTKSHGVTMAFCFCMTSIDYQ